MPMFTPQPIGFVRSPFKDAAAIPKGLGAKHLAEGSLEILPVFESGLTDIEGYSHLIVLWVFDRIDKLDGFDLLVTPPTDDRPHGVFTTRSPRRPNPIGLTIVELLGREKCALRVRGVDMLDGLLQLRIALADDLLQLHRLHARVLELGEDAAGFDGFMLAGVAYPAYRTMCILQEEKEETSNRLPPFGLASSGRSLAGHVTICCLGIDRGFSRGGNILSARGLQHFLGALDFLTCVAMHGEENSALLQAAFVSLCFKFRDTHADQGAGNSAHCSSNAQPRQPCHDRTCGYEWTEPRNRQQTNTCQQTERATNYASCGHAYCRTFGRFRRLFRAHVLGAAETLRQ